jgi:hypothetical protein
MHEIFDYKIVDVKKLRELKNGFNLAQFTLDNGEKIEAPVKFVSFPAEKGDLER